MQLTLQGEWKVLCHCAVTLPEISQRHQRHCRRDVTTQPPPTAGSTVPRDGLRSNRMRLSKRIVQQQWQYFGHIKFFLVLFLLSFKAFLRVCMRYKKTCKMNITGMRVSRNSFTRRLMACDSEDATWETLTYWTCSRCPVSQSACQAGQQCLL